MALAFIFILLFFVLGVALGPLLLAVLTVALDEDRGHRAADFAVGLGLKSVWKPVLTYTTADELTLKKRAFDEKHDSEYVSFGGFLSSVKRTLHDPQDRLHSFYGTPFGFVDELFGVVVDPRDVILGEELRRQQANGQYAHVVERTSGLKESVRAAFEIPEGQVGVQLSQAAALFGGSFDSQFVDRVRDIYETSQAPKGETSALKQLLAPVMAFAGIVLLFMFVAGQTGGGGGGAPAPAPEPSGNNTTIEVGALLLFISTQKIRERIEEWYSRFSERLSTWAASVSSRTGPWLSNRREDVDEFDLRQRLSALRSAIDDGLDAAGNPHQGNWRDRSVLGVLVLGGGGISYLLYLFFPAPVSVLAITLPLGVWAVIALFAGMLVPPFVASFFGRSLGPIGMLLGKLYITIGLLGYDRPVIDFDGGQYELVEYADRDWEIEPHWYRFAMTRVGIGMPNDPELWPEGTTLDAGKVEALSDSGKTRNAPDDYVITDAIEVGDIKGFVPDKPDEDAVHVRTDRTTGWFYEAGQARRLMKAALENAKRDYGGGQKPLGDKWILGATVISMAMATLFSWVVFF